MPWALAKDETKKDRLATVLYHLCEGISIGAELLFPFMPETSEKVLSQLNVSPRGFDKLDAFGAYPSGNKVTGKPEILFARQDIKEVMAKVAAMLTKASEAGKAADPQKAGIKESSNKGSEKKEGITTEPKAEITYDDFAKLSFRIGEVIACEEVAKSKKLLCSKVKIGDEVRQIVSGIKAHYTPEQMVGKKVMVITNLKPAKLAGIMSEGMILCAEDEEGNLSIMVPERDMPSGAEVL